MYKKLLLVVAILATAFMGNAQTIVVSGGTSASAGSPYFTIKDAVDAINSGGAFTAPVVVDIPANYTETLVSRIVLTATGTSANPLTFQKSGAGANPLITANVGDSLASALGIDVMWSMIGSDNVTIDGIDLLDPNLTGAAMMEVGYGFYKASATDGCNDNVVKNCVITLNRDNTVVRSSGPRAQAAGSIGIEVMACLPTATGTLITQTSIAGASSNNTFRNNTIQNVNMGITLVGAPVASPYTLADKFNKVGGASGQGNNIINFGGGATPAFACAATLVKDQWSSSISFNTIDNNVGGTGGINHTTSQRGVWLFNASLGASCDVNNNIFTIRGAGTGINWIVDCEMAQSGTAGNTININNNQFLNCTHVPSTSAAFVPVWLNTAATNVNVNGNTIDNFSTTTTGLTYLVLNQLANPNGTLSISNNTFSNIAFTGGGTKAIIYTTSALANLNVNSNTILNATLTTATTFSNLYGIYNLGTISGTYNCIANSINGVVSTAPSGTNYGIYTGSPANGNFNNNTIENFSYSTLTSTGTAYGIYDISSGVNMNYIGNIVRNFSTPLTGSLFGIREFGITGLKKLINNQVYNFFTTPGGVGGMTVSAIGLQTGSTDTISGNVMYSLNSSGTTGGTGGTISGILVSGGTTNRIFNNKIYDLSTNSTGGFVYGMQISGGTTHDVYNNIIGDLRMPFVNAANNLNGINFSGGTTINAYYNTVWLNAPASAGALFGSSALNVSTTPALTLRNNIFINLSPTNGATGFASAYRRSSTTLTTYLGASNNNIFFAGIPSVNRLIYYDGTNSDQTLSAYKTRVTPRDAVSLTENVAFLSTVGSNAGFLHIDPAVATQAESGGVNITPYTTDFDGDIRFGNGGYSGTSTAGTDIGADEGDFILSDITGPGLSSLSLVGNACGLTSRDLTVSISDASGVPTSGTLMPRIYFNKNGGAFSSTAGVLSSGNATNGSWTFTMDYSLIGGVITGDIIRYFVVAQDVAGTPNVSANPSVGAVVVDVNTVTTPPTTPLSYTIVNTLPTNTYAVGVGGDYPTLTAAVNAYNTSCLNGPVVFSLTDVLYNESVTILNNSDASAVNSLTIQPVNPGTVITGNAANGTIFLNGARFVTIDGSLDGFGGPFVSGDNMVVRNTLGTAPAISMNNDARNCGVRWADVQSNNSGATATATAGVINIGSSSGTTGNDNNFVNDCDVHNAPGGNPVVGISALGNTLSVALNNDNCSIINNNIYDIWNPAVATAAVYVGAGNGSWTINDNNIYQTTPRVPTGSGIYRGLWITPNTGSLTSASGFVINNNYIGGSAADGSGLTSYPGTASLFYSFTAMDISVGVGTATEIQGNTFTNFSLGNGNGGIAAILGIGIANGNVNCGTTTGNIIGSATTNGSIVLNALTSFTGMTAIRAAGGTGNVINIANNTVSGINLVGDNGLLIPAFFGISATSGTTVNITNNTVGSPTLANSINVPTTSSTTTSAPTFRCIQAGGSTNCNVTNNLVANINHNNNSGSGAALIGIAGTSGICNISGNTVRNLTHASASTSGGTACPIIGILFSNFTAPSTVSNNKIYCMRLTNTLTSAATQIAGLFYSNSAGTTANNIVERNTIHSLALSNPANATGYITGMDIATGTGVTVRNNMIRLGIDENGNDIISPCYVRGISKNSIPANIYHNTVLIAGNGVGSATTGGSYAMWRTGTAVDEIRNNIFINKRSNATTGASHNAIQMLNTTTLTINNNDYFVSGSGGVLGNIGAFSPTLAANDKATLGDWQTATTQDAASQSVDANFVNPFGNCNLVDLHIVNTIATTIESGAASGTGVTNDIDNGIRQGNAGYVGTGTAPDLGADEFELVLTPCSGTPVAGIISPAVGQKCGTGNQTFSTLGATADVGMVYQWEESASLSGPWANVTGGSGANTLYYTTPVLTGPTTMYYRMVAKCTVSGDSSITTPSTLNVGAPTVFSTVTSPSSNIYCSGGPGVSITASGTPATYSWLPAGSLNAAIGSTVLASPLTNTTYTVTGADANGCTAAQTVAISVTQTPNFTSVAATPSTICTGTTSTLSAVASYPTTPATIYALSPLTGQTYAPLTGTGITIINTAAQLTPGLSSANQDDGAVILTLPFTFSYMGAPASNTATFSTNGWVAVGSYTVGAGPDRTAGNLFINTLPNNTMAAWFKDMGANFPLGTGSMRHGSIGSGVYAFQWDNAVGSGFSDGSTILISFQINIHGPASATPGRIEYIYGPTAGAIAFGASIGIENATGGPNNYVNALDGTGTSTITSTVWPGNGNGYRFDPVPASLTYAWAPAASVVNSTAATTATTTLTSTTVYTVTATNGACSNSTTTTVTIEPLSCGALTKTAINCANTNFTVTAAPIGGGAPYSYVWSDGVGGVYPNAISVPVNKTAGTYTLICTITDNCSSVCSSSIVVTVNPQPAVTLSASSPVFCAPGTGVTLTAGGALTYAYSPNTTLVPTTGSPVVASPLAATTYIVTGTDANGCTLTSSVLVNADQAVSLNSVTASPNSVACGGSSTLTADANLIVSNYCIPNYTSNTTSGDYCTLVSIAGTTFNNVTGGAAALPNYTLYPPTPTTTATLVAGNTYTITTSPGTFSSNDFALWIDYNQDGSFSVAEKIGEIYNMAATPATATFVFTLPLTAKNGPTRFRVREADQATTAMDPCISASFGETEDYTVTITGGVPSALNFAWTQSPTNSTLSSTTGSPITASNISGTTTYTVVATSTAGCSASGSTTVTVAGPCNTVLNLNAFIQGYWDGVSGMVPVLANQFEPTTANACDTITVMLKDDVTYATVATTKAVLNQNGTCTATFAGSYTGSYYIALQHRTAVETWSAAPVSMAGTPTYNFTTSNAQSYGPNMVEVATGVWAMYSGDCVKDPTESVDLTDIAQIELDNGNFAFGYQVTDITGDGSVDLADFPLVELNVNAFIFSNHP